MEAEYTYTTSATLPTSIWCEDTRAESTSTMNHYESLHSVINKLRVTMLVKKFCFTDTEDSLLC
jgi:hypothetical protein